MTVVLVVDDVPAMAEQYAYDLRRVGGFDTLVAISGGEALELLEREVVDCLILDLEMPGMDGFEVLRILQEREMETPVIVYTGTGDYDRCVRAMRLGAHGFIDKAESMERVAREVESALARGRLVSEVRSLRRRLEEESSLVGSSPAMQQLREAMARVAPIPSPVLIVGESGSGKELVARDLHRLSRAGSPFVALNSAAIPENLVESELFGHERGAFTGADRLRKGAFETAGDGTLLLDEIGELPVAAQAKLLRVLEEGQVTRVGGNRQIPIRVRVLAATHRDLEAGIEASGFRQDLYYRLSVHVLQVPPLRERLSDVPELVNHFLDTLCGRLGLRRKQMSRETLDLLMGYDWRKNNVRELRNVVERMIIATDGDVLEPGVVPREIGELAARPPRGGSFKELKTEAERQIVVAALERNDWHITRTAQELGLADHASLLKVMRRHGLKKSDQ
jgi:two-component system nitrogen regulation response regulator NtrX